MLESTSQPAPDTEIKQQLVKEISTLTTQLHDLYHVLRKHLPSDKLRTLLEYGNEVQKLLLERGYSKPDIWQYTTFHKVIGSSEWINAPLLDLPGEDSVIVLLKGIYEHYLSYPSIAD